MTGENELYLKILDGTSEEAKRDKLNRATVDAASALFYRSHPRSSIQNIRQNESGDISILGLSESGRPLRELFRRTDLRNAGGESEE
jgi:hypothetical protein